MACRYMLLAALLAGALFAIASPPARATMPGKNGLIAFSAYEPSAPCYERFAVFTIGARGHTRRRRVSPCGSERFSWSPDGKRLAFLQYPCATGCHPAPPDRVYTVRPDGTDPHYHSEGYLSHVEWGPNPDTLAWSGQNGSETGLYVGPLEDPFRTRLNTGEAEIRRFDWSPDGTQLAVTELVRWGAGLDDVCAQIVLYDAVSGARGRVVVPVETSDDGCYGGGSEPSWSPDGRRIAFSVPPRGQKQVRRALNLYSVDRRGKNRARLIARRGIEKNPVWSPDGRFMAYTFTRLGEYRVDLVVARLGGGKSWRLARGASGPEWQPRLP